MFLPVLARLGLGRRVVWCDVGVWDDSWVSYDVWVWAPRAAAAAELESVIRAGAGCDVDEVDGSGTTVVRGARRRYSFTVDGPTPVVPEDVDPGVAALVLGASVRYEVLVEGSESSEVRHALAFARRLAQALDGAMVDQQTGQTWSPRGLRAVPTPAREERVTVVEVTWYCEAARVGPDAAKVFLDVVRSRLPEALPRRYGDDEPLRGRLDRDGDESFVEAWAGADTGLAMAGTVPCIGGSLDAPPSVALQAGEVWTAQLDFLAGPLDDPRWRGAVLSLMGRLADGLPTFAAVAQACGGAIWTGRDVVFDSSSEQGTRAIAHGTWRGIPARSVWWSWLGAPFRQWWDRLPAERTRATRNGVLYDATSAAAGQHGVADPLTSWLPDHLFHSVLRRDPADWDLAATPAILIPRELRKSRARGS